MKVFMYTLSTCPWCRKTKKFFSERNIPLDYVDYDLAAENEQDKIMEEMKRSGGTMAFPFVRIDDEIIVGYNPEKYSELIEQKRGRQK
ncbi:MAG: glutaredoxin family protein [Candidatus Methanoperedens sp.]|nr:glutaredoxin family protein [Candidatus Methanoperedens sp.]